MIVQTVKVVDTGADADGGSETFTVSYLVHIDTATSHAWEVERGSGTGADGTVYPAMGAKHSDCFTTGDQNYLAIKKKAKRAKGGNRNARNDWVVDVTFGFAYAGLVGQTAQSSNIRISVTGSKQTIYTQVQNDDNQTPILNSVGDLYPDPQETVLYDEAISIEFEKTTIDGDGLAALRGCINSGICSITLPQGNLSWSRAFQRHCLKLDTVDYDATISRLDPTVHIWQVKLLLLHRYDGWDPTPPQKGYRWYDPDTGYVTDWHEHAEYLDADGNKLADGASLETLDPVQLDFEADLQTLLSSI